MEKSRIAADATIKGAIKAMAGDHAGALTACAVLCEIDPGILVLLDAHGIYGPRIHSFWTNVCHQDPAVILAVLTACALGGVAGVSEDALNRAIDGGYPIDIDAVKLAIISLHDKDEDVEEDW